MTAELEAEHDVPLTTYDVLRQLALADDGRVRMADLAERVMLSRPGLTGVVGRLEAAGLVTRERAAEDGRGTFAVITDAGLDCLRSIHPTHVASIREHFADRLDERELETLHALLAKLDRPPQK